MRTAVNSLRILIGCAGLALVSWGLPTHALAASCGRAPYAAGAHALALSAGPSAGIALSSGRTAPGNNHLRRESIVGLWHTVYTSNGATAFESFEQWHADGNEFEAADLQIGSMCQGTWVTSDSGTVQLLHVGWNFDASGLTLIGYFTENQEIRLSADGKTYDGTFATVNFDLSGNHVPSLDQSGTVHSTRLTVQ
jgi:hypothetical protein